MYTTVIKRTMASIDNALLRSKFRGCLLGSLLGDCLGAPFEGDIVSPGDKITIQKYFDKLEDPNLKTPFRPYTDDTAMTKCIAKFITDKPEPNYPFLARLFVREFFAEPERGYGQNVVDVFYKLRNNKYQDVFKPASEQFNGSGSFGNGGAMRIAPVALAYHKDTEFMLEVGQKSTEITHTNPLGVRGALLQCLAVQQALLSDPDIPINSQEFCEKLCNRMEPVEMDHEEFDMDNETCSYEKKLRIIQQLLKKTHTDGTDEDIIFCLGNNINAYESVPTAIYCFLRALKDIPTVQTENIFRRAIQYAITLGGDTDTIAAMTGAIAGAYLGEARINKNVVKQCESYQDIIEMADNLFEASGVGSADQEP